MSARAVNAVTGRWSRMWRPPTRRGSRAPFLSSGARTMPNRSTVRKSRVVANEMLGPPGPKDVYAITQASSSGTQVSRGSSSPHSSCVTPGVGASSGSSSTTQLETPSFERATARWLMPRRSSTRHSKTVLPSTSAAPALSTALIGYGHRAGVSNGLAGWRVNSGRCSRRTIDIWPN